MKSTKHRSIPVIILIFLVIIVFSVFDSTIINAKTYEMLMGCVTAGDAQADTLDIFAQKILKMSDGKLVPVVVHGGALGGNEEVNHGVRAGIIQANTQPSSFIVPFIPEFGIFDLPFLFPDEELYLEILKEPGPVFEKAKEIAAERGYLLVGIYPFGVKNFLTTKPINSLEDIKGMRFRVMESPELITIFRSWDTSAVTMPFGEVYTSLQQGVIDGIENPPDITYRIGFHEIAPYYTLSNHGFLTLITVVSKTWFNNLPLHLQNIVLEAGYASMEKAYEVIRDSQKDALRNLKEEANVIELPEEDREYLKNRAYEVFSDIVQERPPGAQELIDIINKEIEKRIQ